MEAIRRASQGHPEKESHGRRILTVQTLISPVALGVLGGLGLVCPAVVYLIYRLSVVVAEDWKKEFDNHHVAV